MRRGGRVCNKRDGIFCLLSRKKTQLLTGQKKSFCRRLPSCHYSRIWYTISRVTMGKQLIIDMVSCIETVQLYLCWLNDSDQRSHSIGYLGDEEGMVLDHGTLLHWMNVSPGRKLCYALHVEDIPAVGEGSTHRLSAA